MLLSNGERGRGPRARSTVRAAAIASATTPASPEVFRYVETPGGTVIVNADHIVELRETTEA